MPPGATASDKIHRRGGGGLWTGGLWTVSLLPVGSWSRAYAENPAPRASPQTCTDRELSSKSVPKPGYLALLQGFLESPGPSPQRRPMTRGCAVWLSPVAGGTSCGSAHKGATRASGKSRRPSSSSFAHEILLPLFPHVVLHTASPRTSTPLNFALEVFQRNTMADSATVAEVECATRAASTKGR
jgi:hypothetical protein